MGAEWSQDEVSQPTEEHRKETPPCTPQINNNESGAIQKTATELKLPHNHEEILKDADAPVDKSSTEKLYDQLYAGVFLNQKKKKYWIDRTSKRNCFMLYARNLSITWAEDRSCWHWPFIKESSDVTLVAAELLNVCWLEIHGWFNTVNLTPRTLYQVVFVLMLKDPAYGWGIPVNFRLILADGSRQEHRENMMDKPRGKWIEVLAGEFETLPENNGNMECSMYEYEGGGWKRGLVIKGILIRPKD
nr:lectin-like [Coffea arabica]XP_027088997.1 lectin-like [Coffea arabica]